MMCHNFFYTSSLQFRMIGRVTTYVAGEEEAAEVSRRFVTSLSLINVRVYMQRYNVSGLRTLSTDALFTTRSHTTRSFPTSATMVIC